MRIHLPVALLVTVAAAAQTGGPRFDAVSIHELEAPYRVLGRLTVSGSLVKLDGYTVGMMVAEAFGRKMYEVDVKSPKHFAYFSVEARAPGDAAPDAHMVQAMLQNMLAERFHLKTHTENRSVPVYALAVSKNGPQLKPGTGNQDCRQVTGPVTPTDRNYRHELQNCRIDRFVEVLSSDRPILNRTNLTGLYDIFILYTPDFKMRNQTEVTDVPVSDAIHQLGLQLEPRSELMDIVVADSYDDLPTAN